MHNHGPAVAARGLVRRRRRGARSGGARSGGAAARPAVRVQPVPDHARHADAVTMPLGGPQRPGGPARQSCRRTRGESGRSGPSRHSQTRRQLPGQAACFIWSGAQHSQQGHLWQPPWCHVCAAAIATQGPPHHGSAGHPGGRADGTGARSPRPLRARPPAPSCHVGGWCRWHAHCHLPSARLQQPGPAPPPLPPLPLPLLTPAGPRFLQACEELLLLARSLAVVGYRDGVCSATIFEVAAALPSALIPLVRWPTVLLPRLLC